MAEDNNTNNFIKKANHIINMLDTFTTDYRYIMKEWEMDMSRVEDCETIFKNAKQNIQTNVSKLAQSFLKCVVFGRVSAGKSALLNALLSNDILPSYGGPTTNSFIEVHKSADGTNYAIFPDSPTTRRDISSIRLADEMANDAIPRGSHIDLYYSTIPLLNDDIVLVDTPGIDTGITMDAAIHRECEGADVLIMLVNSENGIGDYERDFLAQYRREFSNLKVLIVFNKWELIDSEPGPRCDTIRETYKNDAERCLRECLNVRRQEDVARGVYFISALERLNIIKRDDRNVLRGHDSRDRGFDEFFDNLRTMMRESCASRRPTLMKLVCDALDLTCNRIIPNRMGSTELCIRFFENLKLFNNIVGRNIVEIITPFETMYEIFFANALIITNLWDDEDESVTENRLQCLVDETVTVTAESAKVIIRDMVCKSDLRERDYILKILETFYFPCYFDLTKVIKQWNMTDLLKTLKDISKIIKIFTGITVAALIAGPGLIGVGIGIAVPIIDAIAIPAFCAAGVTFGGSVSAVSMLISKLKREAFSPRYSDHEDKIKEKWHLMRDKITQSFTGFLLDGSSKVNDLIEPLDNNVNNILMESNMLRQIMLSTP